MHRGGRHLLQLTANVVRVHLLPGNQSGRRESSAQANRACGGGCVIARFYNASLLYIFLSQTKAISASFHLQHFSYHVYLKIRQAHFPSGGGINCLLIFSSARGDKCNRHYFEG